jgi:hypothetical protein
MAYLFSVRRPIGIAILSLSLSTCSTDGLAPSARIDDTSSVGAIEPVRDVQNRDRQQAYPVNEGPVSTFSDNAEGAVPLDAGPVDANAGMMEQPVAEQRRLPMIDSEPDASVDTASAQPMTVPSEGVNMDAMLGVDAGTGQVVGLAQEQSIAIAEGNASQPVVGGIGEDEVRQLGGPAVIEASADPGYDPDLPPLTAEQIAEEEAEKARFIEQQRRVMQRQQQDEADQQQVAFLPRADNPLTDAEPDFTGRMPSSEVSCRNRLKKLGVDFEDRQGPFLRHRLSDRTDRAVRRHRHQAFRQAQLSGDRSLRQMGEERTGAFGTLSLSLRDQDDQAARRLFLPDDEFQARQPDVGTCPRQCHRRRQVRAEVRQGDRRAQTGLFRLPRKGTFEGCAQRQLQVFLDRAGARQRRQPQGPFPLRPASPQVRLSALRLSCPRPMSIAATATSAISGQKNGR